MVFETRYPARRMGCLMPNISVMGVVIVVIVDEEERLVLGGGGGRKSGVKRRYGEVFIC
jgi:hypothetical protein